MPTPPTGGSGWTGSRLPLHHRCAAWPGGRWAVGPSRAARPFPRRVPPAAAPARAGGVVGYVVHPPAVLVPDLVLHTAYGDELGPPRRLDQPRSPARPTGSTSASVTASRSRRPVRRRVRRWPRASRTCCSTDGAYFSLQKPELQALRALIEEARALQDSRVGRLRISRFQAGLWDELAALGVVVEQAHGWAARRARPARAGRRSPAATAARRSRAAAALPARRLRLAGLPVAAPARRHPRRRHGAGQDAAGAGADLPRARASPASAARSWSSRRPASSSNWAAEAARFAPTSRVPSPTRCASRLGDLADDGRRGGRRRHLVRRCSGSTTRPTRGRSGRAGPRRGAVREEPPGQAPPVRRGCRRRSSWRSPARRWRTT